MEKVEDSGLFTMITAALAGTLLLPVQPVLGGTLLAAVGVWSVKYYREHSRLSSVFRNCGLTNKDGQVLQLREHKYIDEGVMFRYSLPPGFCIADIEKHHDAIENYLGKPVSITAALKDVVITAYNDGIDQYDFTPSDRLEIGRGRSGTVYLDFERYPHCLIAGETGSGKSTLLRGLIVNLILQDYKLHLVDLKGGTELGIFRNHSSVVNFARTQSDAALDIAQFAYEMDQRYEEFFDAGVISKKGEKHVLIVDEFAEIHEKSTMDVVRSIAARGRACGYNMIIATQRPSANIVDGDIKANLTNIIGLKTTNDINSRIIIDQGGLERLRGQGHGIFKCGGTLTEFQSPYLSEKKAKELIS